MNLPYDPGQRRPSGPNWSRINQWLLWIGLAAAVAWMFFRHNAHLLQLLPFLFILACPLMHIFGHGGHGGHGDASPRNTDKPSAQRPEQEANQQPPAGGHAGHHH
ncbi:MULTISPECIES: DUF2933 domain-containing protein [Comamonadaceae]|uniref:DUF2933 domain-containing protein n=1 Tax=Comamonadaceae TaxID=80864 RepID=UPI0000DCE716|nr:MULTISPECIES: DUF2933 domain-containing protein [Comamonadaceae]ABM41695.1 hypothetical protein Ajs_1491 [Acidovorax sp. JS42]MBS0474387.1 DUF2933 domain-containing protein [Pseudomonadota bacterium]